MKTTFKSILTIAVTGGLLSFASCDDFMDVTPTTEYTQDQVFGDAGITQLFVNNIYDYAIDGAREHTTTGLTDDAYFTHNYGQIAINETNVSESDLQWYKDGNNPFKWSQAYKGIYYANLVLENIDQVPEKSGFSLDQMKGETYFLRAFIYTDLIRGFGGVPLVDRTFGLDQQDEMMIGRSNIADCLDFIVKDLDQAIALLPETYNGANLGRATKGAAMSLKARVLLHVASPLYADRTVNTLDVNQYNGDRQALYQQALDMAKAVINSGNYGLVDCTGATITEIADKYHSVVLTNNEELIFTKQFASSKVTNNLGLQHGPNGYHNWSGTTPTNEFVMHFEMEDGSLNNSLTQIGDHQVGNPYNGREPRFYACIGFDGGTWGRQRPSDAYPLDPTPLGQLQCGAYELSSGGVDVSVTLPDNSAVNFSGAYGIDTRQGPIEDWNGSWTAYYEKKLIDVTVDAANNPQITPYPYIRLAEIYLIAAEAAIELNKLDEAASYIDAIRARVSRPDTKTTLAVRGQSLNQSDLRSFLQQERRTELCYEDSRYYDVRRWMIAPQTASKKVTGMTVFARLKAGKSGQKPYVHDESTWDYHYYVRDLSFRENRKWDNKMYFAPISRDEINRNKNLVQNPGMQ